MVEANLLCQAGLILLPYSWEEQQAMFPEDYAEDWADYKRLKLRAASGDFDEETT